MCLSSVRARSGGDGDDGGGKKTNVVRLALRGVFGVFVTQVWPTCCALDTHSTT